MRTLLSGWLVFLVFITIVGRASNVAGSPSSGRHPTFFITPTWGTLSSPLGWRHDPFQPITWSYHWGLDIAATAGTPVVASAAGVVRYAAPFGGYGGTIVIEHLGQWATVYGHLDWMGVKPWQSVAQGAVIGTVGNTGHSTGPHLHFEIRHRGIPLDPLLYLNK